MERDPKRMFKVIVAGGVALVSVGSLVAVSSCGSDTTTPTGTPNDATSDSFPHEGPPDGNVSSNPPPPDDAAGYDAEAYDAGDADAAFPPII